MITHIMVSDSMYNDSIGLILVVIWASALHPSPWTLHPKPLKNSQCMLGVGPVLTVEGLCILRGLKKHVSRAELWALGSVVLADTSRVRGT